MSRQGQSRPALALPISAPIRVARRISCRQSVQLCDQGRGLRQTDLPEATGVIVPKGPVRVGEAVFEGKAAEDDRADLTVFAGKAKAFDPSRSASRGNTLGQRGEIRAQGESARPIPMAISTTSAERDACCSGARRSAPWLGNGEKFRRSLSVGVQWERTSPALPETDPMHDAFSSQSTITEGASNMTHDCSHEYDDEAVVRGGSPQCELWCQWHAGKRHPTEQRNGKT